MSNILITGACGFIGSHLTELCINRGYNVRAFDRYNSDNNIGWLENSPYKNDIEVMLGDIRDYDSVYKAVDGCDIVIHLAALIGIPYSYVSPMAYIKTNVEGTYNILEASKNLSVDQTLVTSTSETYGTAKYVPIDEKHPSSGQSPYSASKIAADQLAYSYYSSFELPIKIIRPFNTYGPRQSARAIIPTIISQVLKNDNKIFLGSLEPTRDLTYVKDTCDGFLEILSTNKLYGEATNIGMSKEISIGDLANNIIQIIGSNIKIESDNNRLRPKNSEVYRLLCDNSKLMKHTKWNPKYDLQQGLVKTIEWVKANINYYKLNHYNL